MAIPFLLIPNRLLIEGGRCVKITMWSVNEVQTFVCLVRMFTKSWMQTLVSVIVSCSV